MRDILRSSKARPSWLTMVMLVSMAVAAPAGADQLDLLFDGVNVAIPDSSPAGVVNTQNVATLGTITDVDVDIHVTHTWQGDMIIELTHDGATVPLLYRAGDSNGTGAGFSADNLGSDDPRFVFDDEAAEPYDSSVGWGTIADPGIADVGGSWIPYGVFPAGGSGGLIGFDGQDTSGDWTLVISDNASGDTGTLMSWSLHITYDPVPVELMRFTVE